MGGTSSNHPQWEKDTTLKTFSPCGTGMDIWYEVMGEEGLGLIEPLWMELRQMHRARSVHFSDALGSREFGDRRDELLEKSSGGLMRVELARTGDGALAGYCVSTIDGRLVGEVDSLFVSTAFRGSGIGTKLMQGSLRWMEGLGVRKKVLTAIVGNEEVHAFYARFGFRPKCVMLEHVPDTGTDHTTE